MSSVCKTFWEAIRQIGKMVEEKEFEITLGENVRLFEIRRYYEGRYKFKFSLISEKSAH